MSESQFPEPLSTQLAEEGESTGRGINLPPPVLIGAAVVALIAVIALGAHLLRSRSDQDGAQPTLDPTELAVYSAPTDDTLLMDSGTPQPQAGVPISLTLKGLEYTILPYRVQGDGEWLYPEGQSGAAVWVYGTIINYVIGLEGTDANKAMLQNLVAGDEITMTTSNGSVYYFGFANREEVAPDDTDLFVQGQPGLTLVSLGGKDESRWAVHATYSHIQEAGTAGQTVGPSVSIGEPAHLGEIRVTALATSYLFDDPRVPEGWAFFQVDYQVENFSSEVLDPNRFRMELQDGTGATYSINLPASEAGAFGFLLLTIPPNTMAQGTAGYLVPAPLQGPKLSWSFSRLDAPESVVKVLVDFQSPQESMDPRQLADIVLSGAELSGDRTLVTLWGTVSNNSEALLTVAPEEVSLTGDGEPVALRGADPALPWNLQPGDVLSFRLTYQRPGSGVATFTIIDRPFEISGLE